MAHQVTGLSGTAVSSSQINLEWDDVATLTGETYDIERDGVVVVNDHTLTTYSDTGLASDTEYTYRVRAVDGTEAAFEPPSGNVAWYDFGDISTVWQDAARTSAVTADGQAIKGVTDLSGNGKHLSEATNGPTYKTAIINGESVARFDGTDDLLKNASMPGGHPQTVILVARKRSAPSAAVRTMFSFGSGNARMYTWDSQSATKHNFYEQDFTATMDFGPVATDVFVVIFRINTHVSMDIFFDGGSAADTGDPGDDVTGGTTYTYGAIPTPADFGDYDYGEVFVFNVALSSADLNDIGAYLSAKWGTTWTTVP